MNNRMSRKKQSQKRQRKETFFFNLKLKKKMGETRFYMMGTVSKFAF
jgi:hypothetical protein